MTDYAKFAAYVPHSWVCPQCGNSQKYYQDGLICEDCIDDNALTPAQRRDFRRCELIDMLESGHDVDLRGDEITIPKEIKCLEVCFNEYMDEILVTYYINV